MHESPHELSGGKTSASRKSSLKLDEALKISMKSLKKTVLSGSDVHKANLHKDSVGYVHCPDEVMTADRLLALNDLFKLNTSTSFTPMTGLLLREGFMRKRSRKSDDKVYGILTSEVFAYGKEVYHLTGPTTMEMNHILPLTETLIDDYYLAKEEEPNDDKKKTSEEEVLKEVHVEEKEDPLTLLCVLSKNKSFALKFPSVEERKKWFDDISAACSAAQQKAGVKCSVDDMSPVWKQDKATSECEVCCKGFNIFFRRHHCRNCGKCVCENCLVEKIRIPALDPRALFKVCSACSIKLKDERKYMR